MKNFRTHILEQEHDYVYFLVSINNITTDAMIDMIKEALGRFDIIAIEKSGSNISINKKLDNGAKDALGKYPFNTRFYVKITLANPLSSEHAIEMVSIYTKVSDQMLAFLDEEGKTVIDGAEFDQHMHPMDKDDIPDIQDSVGDKRAKSLVSDLLKELDNTRKIKKIERPIYENFVISHKELDAAAGRAFHRGFYVVETVNNKAHIVGPYASCPDCYETITNVPKIHILNETVGDIMEYDAEINPDTNDDENDENVFGDSIGKVWHVSVIDQDSGKEYNEEIRAVSGSRARKYAVEKVANDTKKPKERFLPKQAK